MSGVFLCLFYYFPYYNNIIGGGCVNSCELTTTVTALANTLACKFNNEELSILASVLVQLGDTLATIATQRSICEALNKTKE